MNEPLTPEDVASLRRTYLLSGLEDDQFLTVIALAHSLPLAAGQVLFQQGDAASAFYWVSEGLVRLYRCSPQGDEKVIELVSSGRYFAEAALFMGGRFPVNAAAQTNSRLIAFDSAGFKAWLSQDAARCFRLLGGMSARLHKMVNEIDALTLMKGTDRLMQYLLDHSEPDIDGRTVVELEAPKQVIASRIGVKPETLSRLLHKLSDLGGIEMQGTRVILKDLDKLPESGLD
jgi:CRP-like cAMP-binding protein